MGSGQCMAIAGWFATAFNRLKSAFGYCNSAPVHEKKRKIREVDCEASERKKFPRKNTNPSSARMDPDLEEACLSRQPTPTENTTNNIFQERLPMQDRVSTTTLQQRFRPLGVDCTQYVPLPRSFLAPNQIQAERDDAAFQRAQKGLEMLRIQAEPVNPVLRSEHSMQSVRAASSIPVGGAPVALLRSPSK